MQLTWNILSLEKNSDQVVTRVLYLVSGTDHNITVTRSGNLTLNPVTDQEKFVDFANLTEQIVIDWIKDKLGPNELVVLETDFAKEIQTKLVPENTMTTPPWIAQ
jgi:hypothetical protein